MAVGSSASLEIVRSGRTEFQRDDDLTWTTRIPAA